MSTREFPAWSVIHTAERLIGKIGFATNKTPKIVNYHSIGVSGGYDNVTTSDFRVHLEWLSEQYDVVPLRDIFETGNPNKQVAITFDDGLASFREHALPLLREFQIPATVYLIGAAIDRTDEATVQDIREERLKTPEALLTSAEVKTFLDEPLVTVGAHTMTHPDLSAISSHDVLEHEIVGGKQVLEDALGVTIEDFAYPYNRWTPAAHEYVQQAFQTGVQKGGEYALISELTDRHLLPRVNGGVSFEELQCGVGDFSTFTRFGLKRVLTSPGIFKGKPGNEVEFESH